MTNKKLLAATILLGASFGSNVVAKENYDDRLYVAPSASYLRLDDDRLSSRNGFGASLGLGKALDEKFNVEGKGFYNRYKKGSGEDAWNTFGAAADLQYYFSREKIAPYAVAGLGLMESRTNKNSALGAIAEAGLGLAYKLNENFSLRSDIRYRYNRNFNNNLVANESNEYSDMVVNFGLVIPLGAKYVAPPAKKAPQQAAALVETSQDSDNDGVKNALDECPNTKSGIKVNESGCDFIALTGVNFKVNSAELTIEAKAALDKVAQDLNNNSQKKSFEIQGHTSSDGNVANNLTLSQKRAQAVADYLVSKGVTNKISSKGFGSQKLAVEEKSAADKLKNRRVELIWK